ncbi:MAG: cobalamin B12-binding domain-containing protein, partial [Chloroflexi bacterium]|nr:cobalamin B12-binding domain-containing protein [Chloroflexota bacterium]
MIILYNPQSSAGRKPILPFSLLALGAVLEGKYDYCIVDGNLEPDPLARLDSLIRAGDAPRPPGAEALPPILAGTVMPGPQLQQAVPLCRALKRRHPALVVVWGGYFPTQHWEACLRSDFVDYVVRGHGELVLLALLDHLSGRTPGAKPLPLPLPGLLSRTLPPPHLPLTNPQSLISNLQS